MQIYIIANIIEKMEATELLCSFDCIFFIIDIGKSDAICNVDGKVYRAGQFFNPNSNPELMCVCLDGYTGII